MIDSDPSPAKAKKLLEVGAVSEPTPDITSFQTLNHMFLFLFRWNKDIYITRINKAQP